MILFHSGRHSLRRVRKLRQFQQEVKQTMRTRNRRALIGAFAISMLLSVSGIASADEGTTVDPTKCVKVVADDGQEYLMCPTVEDNDNSEEETLRDRRPFEGGGSNCALDKIATYAEQYDDKGRALQHRIEVGGGGTQHFDYYPGPGVQTISYVVGPQEPVIWHGFGSPWEGQCGDDGFDYVEDAAGYASGSYWQPGRLDNGHSGLVMDTRDCTLYDTIWNDLDEDGQANRMLFTDHLLDAHRANQDVVPCEDLTSRDVETYNVDDGNTRDRRVDNDGNEDQDRSGSCPDAERLDDIIPARGRAIEVPGDGWRVYNFWTNKRGHDQGERKLLLSPDMNPSLQGGGSLWQWPADCMDEAIEGFLENPLPAVMRYHDDTSFDDAYIERQIKTLQDEGLSR